MTISGCTGDSVPTGTVSGKATYSGKPVPQGCSISFVSNSGFVAVGVVDTKGEYKLKMDGKDAATVNGAHLKITTTGGVKLNADVNVVKTDIECTNGVIHVVDSVLLPSA